MTILQALANPHRLRILELLLIDQPCKVGDIAVAIGLSQPATSQHLKILASAGLIKKRRDQRMIWCSICDPRVAKIVRMV